MKFDLDPMIEEMRDVVARWVEDNLAPRAAEIDESNQFRVICGRNWGSLVFSELPRKKNMAGSGLGYVAHVVVTEEISRGSGSVGLSYGAHSNLCVNQLSINGNKEQKAK